MMENSGIPQTAGDAEADSLARTVPDWFSAAMADTPRTSFVPCEGADIEVLAWGDREAPGLHLLHGFRAHAGWWKHVAPLLAQDYHVVASSWSGMGRSGRRPDYSLAQHAREAIAVGEATGLFENGRRPIMAAHSLGGHTGVLIAAEYGERLGGMLLVDTGLGPEAKQRPRDPRRRVFADAAEAVERFRLTPPQPAYDFIVDRIAADSLVPITDGEGFEWAFDPAISAKLERPHYWDVIPQARCRTAWLRGEKSRVVPEWLVDLQKRQVKPGTPMITLPAAGHHLMVDHPLQLVTAIRAFAAIWT